MLKRHSLFISFMLLAAHVQAASDRLATFIATTRSVQAEFIQEVQDRNGRKLETSSGTMQFLRPGRFRWEYRHPYAQLIIGDGVKFWMYDPDLHQVTVKKLDAALGSSPAALLSGSNEIGRSFTLQEEGVRDGLEWIRAIPKTADNTFRAVRMGFDDGDNLVRMELQDAFGQVTVLRFSALRRNPPLDPALFRFTPPKGTDVLGE